jgi:hypothetical protein
VLLKTAQDSSTEGCIFLMQIMATFPYKDDAGQWHVQARFVNTVHIAYECPFCWTKYKENGDPASKAKRVVHHHGSCGSVNNRIEDRCSHCTKERGIVFIHITDETSKDSRPRNAYGVVTTE